MGDVLYEGKVTKFSLGRTVGVSTRNWKTRIMRVTRTTFSYGDSATSKPKLEIPLSGISVVFKTPTVDTHPEAKAGQPMIVVRLFDDGVFNLLVKFSSDADRQSAITALTTGLENVKGAQLV